MRTKNKQKKIRQKIGIQFNLKFLNKHSSFKRFTALPFVGSIFINSGNFLMQAALQLNKTYLLFSLSFALLSFYFFYYLLSLSFSLYVLSLWLCLLNGFILIRSCSIVSVEELKKNMYERINVNCVFLFFSGKFQKRNNDTHTYIDTHKSAEIATKSLELDLRYEMKKKHLVNIHKIWKDLNWLISKVLKAGKRTQKKYS